MNALLLSCALIAANFGLTSEIMEISGTVNITHQEKQVTAQVGMLLQEGDIVTTGKDGRIAFMMPGNALVSLGSDTSLVIEESAENKSSFSSTVKLIKGRLRSLVGGIFGRKVAFNTKTPNAVAGVRGTYIIAEVNDGTENFYTINGKQEIKHNNGSIINLGAGQGISVMPSGFGAPLTMDSSAISQLNNATMVPLTLPENVTTNTVNSNLSNPNNNAATSAVMNGPSTARSLNMKTGDILPQTPAATDSNIDINVIIK